MIKTMTPRPRHWIPAIGAAGSALLMCLGIGAMLHPAAFATEEDPPVTLKKCTGDTEDVSLGFVDCKGPVTLCGPPVNDQCLGDQIRPLGGSINAVPCKKGAPSSNWKVTLQDCVESTTCVRKIENQAYHCVPEGTVTFAKVGTCYKLAGDCVQAP